MGAEDAQFTCTVLPNPDYACNVESTEVVCSAKDKSFVGKHPKKAACLNIGHKCTKDYAPHGVQTTCKTVQEGETNDNTSELSWSKTVDCCKSVGAGGYESCGVTDTAANANNASSTGISL